MSDPLKIVTNVPKVIAALAETDLSLVEMAAVCRVAAEACTQAQILQEVSLAITRGRAK